MKAFYKRIILVLILTISATQLAYSAEYILPPMSQPYTQANGGDCKVLQVIDGEALKVQMLDTKEIALVKLIGVDTKGNINARLYLSTELMGKTITLKADASIPTPMERWNYMYVYSDNKLINSELIQKGYAQANPLHSSAALYSSLTSGQATAQTQKVGVWEPYTSAANTGASSTTTVSTVTATYIDVLNINTATAAQLQSLGFDASTASNIVSFRGTGYYRNIYALKNVSGITTQIIDTYKSRLTVCTNINKASAGELSTLIGLTQAEIDAIIKSRTTAAFAAVPELVSRNLINPSKYNQNAQFLSITDVTDLSPESSITKANINTASRTQLMATGLTDAQADSVVGGRGSYTYKNLEEFADIPNLSTSSQGLTAVVNKYSTYTDINNAGNFEIQTLFGDSALKEYETVLNNRPYGSINDLASKISADSFKKIYPYIYIGGYSNNYININTASKPQLMAIGLSDEQASSVYQKTGSMLRGKDIPVDLSAFDKSITLYTNVNKAGLNELLSLSSSMDAAFANTLIAHRNTQPFASKEAVRQFFIQNGRTDLYNIVSKFIIIA